MPVNPDRYARVRDIFGVVRALPEPERSARLRTLCEGDATLEEEVSELLGFDALDAEPPDEAHDRAPSTPWLDEVTDPERIGPYRILRRLGQGGMGVVYEGEQAGTERRVAVKVVRPELVEEGASARFAFEMRVLGRLEHPGIARIYDAGTDGATRPYFAMELIEGEDLLAWRERARPDRDRVVQLLTALSEAVEHAHTKGVVHRDLKPENVLVDATGMPRILDFGIARVVGEEALSRTLATGTGALVGTVPYMAPEQARGGAADVDTRTDVHALGVIGYELLTGRLPRDLHDRSLAAALDVLRTEPPIPLARLDPMLGGDLEAVLGQAVASDPTRRYASAGELARDLGRLLAREPVRARSTGRGYRLRLFIARNRLLVAAATAGVLALLAGTVTTAWQAHVAEEARVLAEERLEDAVAARQAAEVRLDDAEAAYAFLSGVLDAATPDELGKNATIPDALSWAAENGIEAFADRPRREASVQAALGRAAADLGLLALSETAWRRALELREALPDHAGRSLAETRLALSSVLLRVRKPEEAIPHLTRAREHFENDAEPPVELATTLHTLSSYLRSRGRFSESLELQPRIDEIYRARRGDDHPDRAAARNGWGESLRGLGRFEEAIARYEEGLAILERHPGKRESTAAALWNNRALAHRALGQSEAARDAVREAVAIAERIYLDRDPRLAAMHLNLSRMSLALKDLQTARQQAELALAVWERMGERGKQQTGLALTALGLTALAAEDLPRARQWLVEALKRTERAYGPTHAQTREAITNLHRLALAEGNEEAADAYLARAREIARDTLPESSWVRPYYDVLWAERLIAREDALEEARTLLVPAWRRLRAHFGDAHGHTIRAWSALVKAHADPSFEATLRELRAERAIDG